MGLREECASIAHRAQCAAAVGLQRRVDKHRSPRASCTVLTKRSRFRSSTTLLYALALIGVSAPVEAISEEEWVTTFVRFVDWPTAPPDNLIVVCQPPGAALLALHGAQVRGMTLQVVPLKRASDAERCHVFTAMSQREAEWLPLLGKFKSRPTLTLGAGPRFCEAGGAICVVKDESTGVEKYQVNLDAMARAGLKVRLQLLRHQRSGKAHAE